MDFDLRKIIRKNIADLIPYSSARDEYTGTASILLDANESPYNDPLNRYPDPHQRQLKKIIADGLTINVSNLFLGNGSDEAIDLLIRAFCRPGEDEVISIDPSYGMYEVSARINDIKVRKVLLNEDFSLNSLRILEAVSDNTKLIFLCSPNNPTGNILEKAEILKLVNNFNGITIVDEAYIDFAGTKGLLDEINNFPNLVILRTLSKAWGLAGIRLGMAIGSSEIVTILDKIKYPYNINVLTQNKAAEMILQNVEKEEWVKMTILERQKLSDRLSSFDFIEKVFPSDANFLLVKINKARDIYEFLKDEKIIVRDRSKVSLCEACLRITVGNPEENNLLHSALKKYQQKIKE